MKILIIQSSIVDYLQDAIYLGFKDRFGVNVESFLDSSYLYKDNTSDTRNMWGLGFTYSKILDSKLHSLSENLEQKIYDNYYDLILYTMVPRHSFFLSQVIEATKGKNVFLVNGLDMNWDFEHYTDKCLYFKRELIEKKEKNIFPIHYAIHPTKLVNHYVEKTQELSDSIPSMDNCTHISSSHYIFNNEKDYYENYQKSKYGITKKKGGWDSMRHYEIMANKCVPLFEDLENCPNLTLTNLPKKLLIEIKNKYNKITETEYESYNRELYDYTKEHLTTNSLCDYILNFYS
jgi:hypothetical protein